MSARTVIELHSHPGLEAHLFRITVDGEERAARLDAVDAERQLARITERMRSREGPLSVIRHVSIAADLPSTVPCTWVPPECMALFDVEGRSVADRLDAGPTDESVDSEDIDGSADGEEFEPPPMRRQ